VSAHSGDADLDGLRRALWRELEAARGRVEELVSRRHTLERELDAVLAAERERRRALEALTAVAREAAGGAEIVAELRACDDAAGRALAGSDLREAITRVALRRNAQGEAVHWRQWLGWLRDEGLDAAGKRAEATFQTQLARSPLVRRSDRDGVYILDVRLVVELRDQLVELHHRLDELPAPEQLTLLGDAREARRQLVQQIGQAERRLEEAWRTLTEELGADWPGPEPPDADDVAQIWIRRARQAV
jgi:hypothetical protein